MSLKQQGTKELVGYERMTPAVEVIKRFVGKNSNREVLKYGFLHKNGHLYATDSNCAVCLNNVHTFDENLVIEPKNLSIYRGFKYPDIMRHFEIGREVIGTVELNKEVATDLVKVFKFFNSKRPGEHITQVKVVISNGKLHAIKDKFSLVTEIDNIKGEKMEFSVQPAYMVKSLEAFLKYSKNDSITLEYRHKFTALKFTNEEIEVLVLPLRTYE